MLVDVRLIPNMLLTMAKESTPLKEIPLAEVGEPIQYSSLASNSARSILIEGNDFVRLREGIEVWAFQTLSDQAYSV